MPEAPSACPTCGPLAGGIVVNVGREERMPAAARALVRMGLSDSTDVWTCPDCADRFEWQDHPQHYGSGNNWDETLQRLTDAATTSIDRVLLTDLDSDACAFVRETSAHVSEALFDSLLGHLAKHDPARFAKLAPGLVDLMLRKPWNNAVWRLLQSSVKNDAGRCRSLADLLRAATPPADSYAHLLIGLCEQELARLATR